MGNSPGIAVGSLGTATHSPDRAQVVKVLAARFRQAGGCVCVVLACGRIFQAINTITEAGPRHTCVDAQRAEHNAAAPVQ